jgi:hypothetical protein
MTGIELIAEERRQQVEKHGFNEAHDSSSFNQCGELKEAALHLLSDGALPFPSQWMFDWKIKFSRKSKLERLTIAGALIAAEIDRLNRINN